MDNKEKSILMWLMSGAGLLLAVLYSPFGSPDLYKQRKYFADNQGVTFNGRIENAPLLDIDYQDDDSEIAVPLKPDEHKNTAVYRVTNNTKSFQQSAVTPVKQQREPPVSNQNNGSGGGGSVGIACTKASSGNRSHSEVSVSNLKINDSTSLASNLNVFGDNSTRQGAVTAIKSEEPTVGIDPLENTIIPVGDGWSFLLLLAAGYGMWKMKKNNPQPLKGSKKY